MDEEPGKSTRTPASQAGRLKVFGGSVRLLPTDWSAALGRAEDVGHGIILTTAETKTMARVRLQHAGFTGSLNFLRVADFHTGTLLAKAGVIDLRGQPGIWVLPFAVPIDGSKVVQINLETGEPKVVAEFRQSRSTGTYAEKLPEEDKVERLLEVLTSAPISPLGIKVEPVMIDGKKYGDHVFIADVLIGFRPETGTAPKRVVREVFTALADVLQATLGWPMTAQELFEQTVAEARDLKKKKEES